VFRNQHPSALWPVRLKGIERDASFEVKSVRTGFSARVRGALLLDEGLRVELANPNSCELFVLRRL
jgi:hypothetical protein